MTDRNTQSVCTVQQPAPQPATYTAEDTRRSRQHPDAIEVEARHTKDCTDYHCPQCDYRWRLEWFA